jgi:Cys-rich repeat protein
MKEVYICLLFIIAAAYILCVYYRPLFKRNYEAFNVSMCQEDSDCPTRFKCESAKCVDTRPKGN